MTLDKCPHCGGAVDENNAVVEGRRVEKVAEQDYAREEVGETTDVFMIFKVGDRYYRKNGTGDSYGDIRWDGRFEEVQPKTKIITVFE